MQCPAISTQCLAFAAQCPANEDQSPIHDTFALLHARIQHKKAARTKRTTLNLNYTVSIINAIPWPPPIHNDAHAYLPPRRRNSWATLKMIRVPLAPTG